MLREQLGLQAAGLWLNITCVIGSSLGWSVTMFRSNSWNVIVRRFAYERSRNRFLQSIAVMSEQK